MGVFGTGTGPMVTCAAVTGGLLIVAATSYHLYRRRRRRVLIGRVSGLVLHPIKGCGQLYVSEAECTDMGLKHSHLRDRYWALVDPATATPLDTKFHPKLVQIKPRLADSEYFIVEAPGMGPLKIPYRPLTDSERIEFNHADRIEHGKLATDEINSWFASFMEIEGLMLVQLADRSDALSVSEHKIVPSAKFGAKKSDKVPYMYAAPYLVCSQGSLDDLNANLPEGVEDSKIGAFRPNIVISGAAAWDEDTWNNIYINNIHLKVMTPCFRCLVTTIDSDTGEKNAKSQPLKTLNKMRMVAKSERAQYGADSSSPMFGIYVLIRRDGQIRIGDEVYVDRR